MVQKNKESFPKII